MTYLALYVVTVLTFLALDVVMLKKVMYPLFSSNIGTMMLDSPKMGAAALFYLFYVGGILWFVSIPALQADNTAQAFFGGFFLGLLAYGTYEFTNFATLRGWAIQMVAVDVLWGGILTGSSACIGVSVIKAIS